jgi:hypothetical protein
MKRARPGALTPPWAALALGLAMIVFGSDSARSTPEVSDVAVAVPTSKPEATTATAPTMADAGLPTLVPESVLNRVPTRVRVADLRIDLPVTAPPADPDHFPFCNVAEFLPSMSRPGRPGTTYLFAHARDGMFLPILEASRVAGGRSMLGMRVDVYTSDARRFTYEVIEVRRHVVSLEFAFRATTEQLILQTSEGPRGTPEKTTVIAVPREERPATSAEALPVADPVNCG